MNYAAPDSLAVRVSTLMREKMFKMFLNEFQPVAEDAILDVGVTDDRSYEHSNYFEALYSHKHRIVALGLQDTSFLIREYAGMRYVKGNALQLPFRDRSFDLVHSAAVLEHVGSADHQARMISECVRVARRGVCLTTPNRCFPVEFHTQLPFIHWLPKPLGRRMFRRLGFDDLADEAQLNLLTARDLKNLTAKIPGWTFRIASPRLLGLKSNLVLFGHSAMH